MKLNIIIPCYNEEGNVLLMHDKLTVALRNIDYELIFVNYGSKDKTWDIITQLHNENNNIKGIRFSRNFGKEYALCAGVAEAKGDAVITMDSDLQHPPEYIDSMIEKWQEGYKIVDCIKDKRAKESLKNRINANAFYGILNKLTGYDLKNGGDFKLLDRQVVDEINNLKESQVFFRGLVEWVGYKKCKVIYKMKERKGDT